MKPTLEEVKEHFKDAKVVRCLLDGRAFNIEDYNTYTQSIGIDISIDNYKNGGYKVLWYEEKGYAEIIEYKTPKCKTIKITEEHWIKLDDDYCKVPDGYEIDEVIFKKIEKQLPNSWEEYLSSQPLGVKVMFESKFNSLPETYKALRKLELLRDCYNDGWVADWTDNGSKECIIYMNDKLDENCTQGYKQFLNFKTAELRDKFLENFKDIIEIAKPLL